MTKSNKPQGKVWLTSDLHFGHDREFIYGPRGFDGVAAMNETIIRNWNAIVSPEDDVYVLGDIMLGDDKTGLSCLRRLQGNIHIIVGNHDTDRRIELYREMGYDVEFGARLSHRKLSFYLSHYPTITENFDEEKPINRRVFNLHGHTHQGNKFNQMFPTMYCVGLEAQSNCPVSLDQVVDEIKELWVADN